MNKLTLKKGNKTYDIIINKTKYLLGDNYINKYILLQILKEYFSGTKQSEYSANNTGKTEILYNEKEISLKDCYFFEVTPYFNLSNDLKLTTKSLTTKYLEAVYNNPIFNDLINTINILLISLSDELDSESLIHSEFNSLQSKQLLKLVNPQLIIDNEYRNEFDLSYNEIIVLQLKMIKYILKKCNYNISIILITLPVISDEIKRELEELNNCIVFIDTNQYRDFMNLNEIMFINSSYLDFADEENIYNIINNNEDSYDNLSMEELKMNLKLYLSRHQCEHLRSIKLLLK